MKTSLLIAASIAALSMSTFANDYDESIDGDLSGDHLTPGMLNLTLGSNLVISTQQGPSFGLDVDYLTVNIPAGMRLAEVNVISYVSSFADAEFLGIQAGTPFTTPHDNTKASDLLGGIVYGSMHIGTDILPAMGTLGGATGFTPPLSASAYTLWFNQGGDPTMVTLEFVVESDGLGTNYCVGAANSAFPGAMISASGSSTVSDNNFTLRADNVVPSTPGLFFFGPNQIQLPFGEGFRCVGGQVLRMPPPLVASAAGVAIHVVDMNTVPALGAISPGTTHNFQYWYRDVPGGPNGFNLTDGLSITFQ
ncbi:MAG: hypothetical protein ACI8X5_002741 [Planctomycetota bacterium]|jgi:hypothetical protein